MTLRRRVRSIATAVWLGALTCSLAGGCEIEDAPLVSVQAAAVAATQCEQEFEPCAGDLVGTWKLAPACAVDNATDDEEDAGFPACTVEPTTKRIHDHVEVVTFRADGTADRDVLIEDEKFLTLHESCVENELFSAELFCLGSFGTFRDDYCTLRFSTRETRAESFRWSASGARLKWKPIEFPCDAEDADPVEPETLDYCVRGDELRVQRESASGTRLDVYERL
jgi:hypothetical protein